MSTTGKKSTGIAKPRVQGKASSHRGLSNPVIAAEAARQATTVIPFLIKTAVVCGLIFFVYKKYTNRFVSLKENKSYPDANISFAQAVSRADAIAKSKGLFTNDYDTVARSLSGLNYNGFIRLYNAFGNQRGTFFAGQLNLVEWIRNQFDDRDVAQLGALLNGAFFKNGNAIVQTEETQAIINLIFYDTTE